VPSESTANGREGRHQNGPQTDSAGPDDGIFQFGPLLPPEAVNIIDQNDGVADDDSTIMIIPMNDTTLIVLPVRKSAQMTPMNPNGTENMIRKGWSKDANWKREPCRPEGWPGPGRKEASETPPVAQGGPFKRHGEFLRDLHLRNFFLNLICDRAKISAACIGRHMNDALLVLPLQLDRRKNVFHIDNVLERDNPAA